MKAPVKVSETSPFTPDPNVRTHVLFAVSAHSPVKPGSLAGARADCCTEMLLIIINVFCPLSSMINKVHLIQDNYVGHRLAQDN